MVHGIKIYTNDIQMYNHSTYQADRHVFLGPDDIYVAWVLPSLECECLYRINEQSVKQGYQRKSPEIYEKSSARDRIGIDYW